MADDLRAALDAAVIDVADYDRCVSLQTALSSEHPLRALRALVKAVDALSDTRLSEDAGLSEGDLAPDTNAG